MAEDKHGLRIITNLVYATECKGCGEMMSWSQIWEKGVSVPDIDDEYSDVNSSMGLQHVNGCNEGHQYERDEWKPTPESQIPFDHSNIDI